MQADFWHKLWDTNEIGWHNNEVNELLLRNLSRLELKKNSRIFIPLCGKTVDIKWFIDNDYSIVGVELNEKAIKELFKYLKLEPTIKRVDSFTLYTAKNIDIYVGDIFELNTMILGKVDIIYDRGGIVALPVQMRKRYTALLVSITESAPQLVISYEYDQNLMEGPPFSVKESQLKDYYSNHYNLDLMETIKPEVFKGLDISETVWNLN